MSTINKRTSTNSNHVNGDCHHNFDVDDGDLDGEEPLSLIKDPSAFTALTKIHTKPITDCRFSPDTDQILTGSEDTSVVLWNLPSRDIELHNETINDEHKLVCYRLSDHKEAVTSVAIHERLFASASKDGYVKLWKLLPGQQGLSASAGSNSNSFKQPRPEPTDYKCHISMINSIDFSNDASNFATCSNDMSVKVHSTISKKPFLTLKDGHHNWVKSVRWSKTNDSLLASCGDDGRICIWDIRTKFKQPPVGIIAPKRKVAFNCLDWHPVFGHHIASGGKDSSSVIWDIRMRKAVQIYIEHSGSVNSVAFDSGGSLLLTGSSDKTSKLFDVCEGRNMFTLMSHTAPITSVCFNSEGDVFATGSRDKTVTVWKRNFDTVRIVLDGEDIDNEETIDETLDDREIDEENGYDNPASPLGSSSAYCNGDAYEEAPSVEYRSQEQLYPNYNAQTTATATNRRRVNNRYPNGIIKH